MRVYSGPGLGSFYYEVIRDLMRDGRRVTVRGNDCMEFPDRVVFEYTNPGYCWMRIPGRKWNPFLALAEIPWILSGNGNVEWIAHYSAKMRDFQDGDDPNFHGAYGIRLRRWPYVDTAGTVEFEPFDQIQAVVDKLKADPFSRQAVMSLWDPYLDNAYKSKDYPCNNWVAYELRDGVLNQSVVIRSNDLVWGTPVNAVQFTHIHAYVAGLLDVKMGKLTYFIQNLHVYLDLYKSTLASLVEQAYDDEHIIEAEKAEGFAPFGEEECRRLILNVEDVHGPHNSQIETPLVPKRMSDYVGDIVAMLEIYNIVKHSTNPSHRLLELLGDVRQPFRDLIMDFWDYSQNPLARYAAGFLRRNNDVCA